MSDVEDKNVSEEKNCIISIEEATKMSFGKLKKYMEGELGFTTIKFGTKDDLLKKLREYTKQVSKNRTKQNKRKFTVFL